MDANYRQTKQQDITALSQRSTLVANSVYTDNWFTAVIMFDFVSEAQQDWPPLLHLYTFTARCNRPVSNGLFETSLRESGAVKLQMLQRGRNEYHNLSIFVFDHLRPFPSYITDSFPSHSQWDFSRWRPKWHFLNQWLIVHQTACNSLLDLEINDCR